MNEPNQTKLQSPLSPASAAARGARPSELHPELVSRQQREKLVRFVRLGFLVIFVTFTILAVFDINPQDPATEAFLGVGLKSGWWLLLGIAAAVGGMVGAIDIFTPQKKISTLGSVFLGLLAAMLATVAIGAVIGLLADLYDVVDQDLVTTTQVLVGICLAYLGIATVLQTQDDFRLVIPYVEFAKQIRGSRPILLDSSALIDGRIAGIGRTGVLQSPLVIPRFVIDELQRLGDSRDDLKRSRGRRGLDMIVKLQREPLLDVTIDETPVVKKAVDLQLVELAETMSAMIATTDAQLGRVAGINGVSVLSLHELAAALRPEVIPGEMLTVQLVREGEQAGQGVGFLPDGTMVVVTHGAAHIGTEVEARVTSALQTSAGRLIFGEIPGDDAEDSTDEAPSLEGPSTAGGSDQPEPDPAEPDPSEPELEDPVAISLPDPQAGARPRGKHDRTQARRRNPRR